MNLLFKSTILIAIYVSIAFSIEAQQRYVPQRITGNIKLDGKLDESEWQLADSLSGFMQASPILGAPETEKTVVRMLYNDEFLFVGFHCYDSEPDKIIRFFMNRDFELGNDDGNSVELDTYNDKSTAVLFITNTLNGRFDSEISNNGNDMNDDYNNFWDAASSLDSTGYMSEYRIPFSSLRFQQREKVIMGFRFARLIKRKNELITYPRCDSSLVNIWNNVSQAAEMEFTNLKTKKPIYFTPYVIGNFEHRNNLNSDGTAYEANNTFFLRKHYSDNETLDKILSNIGADLKYGLTKNFTLNLTVNTDFAQAEADNRVINLTKYEINFPEKRNFFLESQKNLSYTIGQSTELFNSRTIGLENDVAVPIIGGVRLTGKQNGLAIGALNMQTTDVTSENISAQNFSVARVRKDYGKHGSYYGGIFTNRISTINSTVSNQAIGLDLMHHFNDKWVTGVAASTTYDDSVKSSFDKNQFLNVTVLKSVSEGFYHGFDFEYVGAKFNPAMGFNAETNYGFATISSGKITKFKTESILNDWTVGVQFDYRWKIQSQLTETKLGNLTGGISWKKGSAINFTVAEYKEDLVFENWQLDNHIAIPVGYYHMFNNAVDFVYDESKSYTAELILNYGDYYGGKIFSATPSFNYILNRYFRIGVSYGYNRIKFPESFSDNGDAIYKSNLVSGDFLLTLSSKFSVKLLAQYDDLSNSYGGNLRLRYNPREGTDLYIIYNSSLNTNRLEAKPTLPVIDYQTVIIKYSITFGL